MNTPSAKADGFSGKLCGNPLAWRLTGRSTREVCPQEHNARSGNISVEGASAVTAVFPFLECLALDRAAFRACLRSSARIDQRDYPTSVCSFVGDELNELIPSGIVNGLGEHPRRQSFDIQVLKSDVREIQHKHECQLVREVPPLIGDVNGQSGNVEFRFALSFAVAPLPGNGSLGAAQRLGGVLRTLRRRHRLACGQRHKRREAHVDANRGERALDRFRFRQLDLKADEPLASFAADHCRTKLGAGRNVAVPAHLDLAWDTDDAKPPGLADRQSVADAHLGAIEASLGTKPRETRLGASFDAAEECCEGLVQPAQDLLFCREAVSSKSLVCRSDGLQLGRLIAVAKRDTASPVGFDALLQTGVVEIAERAEHVRQRSFLRACGKQAKLVAANVRRYDWVSHVEVRSRLVSGAVSVSSTGGSSLYTSAPVLVQGLCAALARGPAFRCRLKATVPNRR